MSQTILDQSQREGLLVLLGRRLHKLDDKALLELERLTRNPKQLEGFVPSAKKTAVEVESPVSFKTSPTTFNRSRKGTVNRRQLLAGLGAVVTVGAVGGATNMLSGRGAHENAERYAQLDEAVQAAIDYFEPDVTTLIRQALVTVDGAHDLRAVAMDCVDSYPLMRMALETWWTETSVVKHDYQAMQLVEGGVKTMTDVLSMLAAVPDVAIEVLGPVIRVELANLDAFSEALQAAGDLLMHLDPALHAADVAHEYLTPWFSSATESDINRRLLYPLRDEFCPEVIDLGMQCQQLQTDWRQRFIEPVNAARKQEA